MKHRVCRSERGLRVAMAAAAIAAGAAGGAGCTGEAAQPAIERKSASALTADEVDRFRRAFEHAVAAGYFDVFNDEHYDHHRNRNHGADVLATSPMTARFMDQASGYRLLPWHRAFILEGEAMLRAALRERNRAEGRDPAEADLLFMPYWDATRDRKLPAWLDDLRIEGGTAIVPPDLPPGHAGYGKPVGSRYEIVFGRWPAQNQVFDELPTREHITRILARPKFVDFYDALDATPELVLASYPAAQQALAALDQMLPGEPAVDTLIAAFSQPPSGTTDPEAAQQQTNALFALGHHAAVSARKATPDTALIDAVEDVYAMFNLPPHLRLHLWAGGLDPADANVRGTVTYFNELCVDPVFWMIHTELDRIWYAWEEHHSDAPPLEGELAVFAPLTADEGAWYGGGKERHLDELVDHDRLPYSYAEGFGH
jgi:hypothetical protein